MKKSKLIEILAMLGMAFASTLYAEEASVPSVKPATNVDEVVTKANLAAYYQGKDGGASVDMTITDKEGRSRTREFNILRLDVADGGDQYFYVYFKGPAEFKKMVFMVWKHMDRDDDRWMYLSALDLVKRIAASDKRTSFVGSDFLYEDVSGRRPSDDTHELIEETDQHYILLNRPKDAGSVEFSHYKVWIDKETSLPIKAEYYKGDALIRIVEATKKETIQGFPTITESKVQNLETGSTTVLSFSNIRYDMGLEPSIFTERYLRRAPREAR